MEPKQNVICPFCDKDIPLESRYCLFCGKELAGQSDLKKADSFTDPDAAIQFCKSCGVVMMPDADLELPYEGAKEMLLVDNVENREFLRELIEAMYDELPAPKQKKAK